MAELNKKYLMYYSQVLNTSGIVNVLLVSTSQPHLDNLGKNLYTARETQQDKRAYKLKVHTCKTVLNVLEYMPEEFYVDFIGFILDANIGNCISEVEQNLSWIDPTFPREKICLINPDAGYIKSTISPFQIWEFATSYQLNLINGQIKRPKDLFNLSKRILNVIEASCGFLNGIPMVNLV